MVLCDSAIGDEVMAKCIQIGNKLKVDIGITVLRVTALRKSIVLMNDEMDELAVTWLNRRFREDGDLTLREVEDAVTQG